MHCEVKPQRPNVIIVAAYLARLILYTSVPTWLFASPVAPESQQPQFFFCRGRVVQLTHEKLSLHEGVKPPLQEGVKPPLREFAIATQAKFVDEVKVSDLVNATYTKKGSQDIVVVLQRLPDIEYNEKRGKEEPMGVSDLVVPAPLSARIFAEIGGGEIEARPPDPREQVVRASHQVEPEEQGIVTSVTWLNPFESELRLDVSARYVDGKLVSPARETVVILDPLTRIVGHLKAGTHVNVLYAYATQQQGGTATMYARKVVVK